jgi:tetratricopeptide (TPR) repeat protein
LTGTAQKSIVYIYFDVVDPNTGAKSTIQGTGFVVSKKGYVLTASHLFRAWRKQSDVDRKNNPIQGTLRDKPGFVPETKPGFVPETPLNLQVINAGDPDAEDVALLKLPDPTTQPYPTAAICFSKAAAIQQGDNLLAFGFPLNFQSVPVTLGTQNAPGGRWAAASAFTEGMSGGPIYTPEGFVVGLVKGGLDAEAVRWITPLQHAANLLNAAGLVEHCIPITADIVVSPFIGEKPDLEVSRQIETALKKELRVIGLGSVSVDVLDKPITHENEAQEAVKSSDVKVVIWGWKDPTKINIRIAVAPVPDQDVSNNQDIGMIDVTPRDSNLAIVATNLQQAAKTASLYIVAQLFYSENNYANGHKAMDAAMKSLPNSGVEIENKSLVEFLKGRLSFSEGNFVDAATHYVSAIKANPVNAAAYNNLAILYSRFDPRLAKNNNDNVSAAQLNAKNKLQTQIEALLSEVPFSKIQPDRHLTKTGHPKCHRLLYSRKRENLILPVLPYATMQSLSRGESLIVHLLRENTPNILISGSTRANGKANC